MGAGASASARPPSAAVRRVNQQLADLGLEQYAEPLSRLGMGQLGAVDDAKLAEVGVADRSHRERILSMIRSAGNRYAAAEPAATVSDLRSAANAPAPLRRVATEGADVGLDSPVGAPSSTRSAPPRSARRSRGGKRSDRVRRWRKGDLIASGAFGSVYQGLNEDTGELLAVKEVQFSPGDEEQAVALKAEVEVMRSLSHPNIVRYLGADADDEKCVVYIFQEWVAGGSISHMLKKYGPLSENVVSRYAEQILTGLAYLHDKGVLHRDIKGRNILVATDGTIKLADFGASKLQLNESQRSLNHTLRGTPYFMAPEVINQTGHGRRADIWSLGGVVLEMVTGEAPWKSMNFKTPMALMLHISRTTDPPPIPDDLSPPLREFLLACFERDPAQRPTAAELLEHPFIVGESESDSDVDEADASRDEASIDFNSTMDNLASCLSPLGQRPKTMATVETTSAAAAAPTRPATGAAGAAGAAGAGGQLPLPAARYERSNSGASATPPRSRSNSGLRSRSGSGATATPPRSRSNSGTTGTPPRSRANSGSAAVPISVVRASVDSMSDTVEPGAAAPGAAAAAAAAAGHEDENVSNWPTWAKREQAKSRQTSPGREDMAADPVGGGGNPFGGGGNPFGNGGGGGGGGGGDGNPFGNGGGGNGGGGGAGGNPFGNGGPAGGGNPFATAATRAAAASASTPKDERISTPPAASKSGNPFATPPRSTGKPAAAATPPRADLVAALEGGGGSQPVQRRLAPLDVSAAVVAVRDVPAEEAALRAGTWQCRDGHVNDAGESYCNVCAAVRGAPGRSPTDAILRAV